MTRVSKKMTAVIVAVVSGCATTPPARTEPSAKVEASRGARAAPDFTGYFGADFEVSKPLDLGTGWLAFGADSTHSGAVRAVWLPDGGPAEVRDNVVTREEAVCDQRVSVFAAEVAGYMHLSVSCTSGEDVLVTEATSYVFAPASPFEGIDGLSPRWEGLSATMESNQVMGCSFGDGGDLVDRDGEVWLVKKPWAERLESDVEPSEPCESPDEAEERLLLRRLASASASP